MLQWIQHNPEDKSVRAFGDIMGAYTSVLKRLGREKDAIGITVPSYYIYYPGDLVLILHQATSQLLFRKFSEYEETRTSLLKSVDLKSGFFIAERAAKILALRSTNDPEQRRRMLELGERAAQELDQNPEKVWGLLALGMTQYRNDQFEAAERTLQQTIQAAGSATPDLASIAAAYLAMSLSRKGELVKARKVLSDLETNWKFELPLDEKDPNNVFSKIPADNILVAWLSVQEARNLIQSTSKVP